MRSVGAALRSVTASTSARLLQRSTKNTRVKHLGFRDVDTTPHPHTAPKRTDCSFFGHENDRVYVRPCRVIAIWHVEQLRLAVVAFV